MFPFERIRKFEKLPYYQGLEVNLKKFKVCFGTNCHLFRPSNLDKNNHRQFLFLWALIRASGGPVAFPFLLDWVFENDNNELKEKSKIVTLSKISAELNTILHRITKGKFVVISDYGRGYRLENKESKI